MSTSRLTLIALGTLLPLSAARADLSSNLIAYYNFEDGIANQVGGGATHNGSYGNGTTYGVTPGIAGTGAGFAGTATYAGVEATSTTDRSDLLVGNALNLAKDDASSTAGSGWFNVPTLNAATLGSSFAISAWFFLAPDADNTGTTVDILRDYVFEGGDNFDVSFGTTDANGSSYVGWLGGVSNTTAPGNLATGQWHHVVHVFSPSGANTTLNIYINGAKVGTTLTTATANMNFTSLNFGAARGGIRVFDGMLDEVAVWNRSRTANDVAELYQRGTNTPALALNADLAAAGKAFVSVDSSDPAGGETFGTGLYNLNDPVSVEMFPALGYLFDGWAAPFNTQEDAFTHTATGSVTITANFVKDSGDPDNDGLSNYQELVVYQTFTDDADTDDDQINDGAEIQQSQTDPLDSQLAAVNYILANLGGVQPGDTVLTRSGGTLTLKLKPGTSTTLGPVWGSLTPASPGVSAAASSGDFLLQVPGTTDRKRFFRVEGVTP